MELHEGQKAAARTFEGHRFMALRAGRRFGKTTFAEAWIADGLERGERCAWLGSCDIYFTTFDVPSGCDVYTFDSDPVSSWRGRRYDRVVIDDAAQAAFDLGKVWREHIRICVIDRGMALVCSNPNGTQTAISKKKTIPNFFYQICTDPSFGFKEYHGKTSDNPIFTKGDIDELKRAVPPPVFRQEYLAEFVDWNNVRVAEGDSA